MGEGQSSQSASHHVGDLSHLSVSINWRDSDYPWEDWLTMDLQKMDNVEGLFNEIDALMPQTMAASHSLPIKEITIWLRNSTDQKERVCRMIRHLGRGRAAFRVFMDFVKDADPSRQTELQIDVHWDIEQTRV